MGKQCPSTPLVVITKTGKQVPYLCYDDHGVRRIMTRLREMFNHERIWEYLVAGTMMVR